MIGRGLAALSLITLSIIFLVSYIADRTIESFNSEVVESSESIDRLHSELVIKLERLEQYERSRDSFEVALSDLQGSVEELSVVSNQTEGFMKALMSGQNTIFNQMASLEGTRNSSTTMTDEEIVRESYISLLNSIEHALDMDKLDKFEKEKFVLLKDPNAVLGVGGGAGEE